MFPCFGLGGKTGLPTTIHSAAIYYPCHPSPPNPLPRLCCQGERGVAAACQRGVGTMAAVQAPAAVATPVPRLVVPSPALEQGLASIEEAARCFASPDPVLRNQGETVLLQLRQSQGAVEHALYALEHAQDPFVQFQALSIVLEALPTLSLHSPSASLPSLATLRDFLFALALSRVEHAALNNKGTAAAEQAAWPQYVRIRAYQAFAATQTRLLGMELQNQHNHHQSPASVMESYAEFVGSNIIGPASALPQHPSNTPEGAVQHARFAVSVGLLAALLDNTAGTSTGAGGSSRHGKAREADHHGLSALQHRWVKAVTQVYLLDRILSSTVYSLSAALTNAHAVSMFPIVSPLIAVLERLVFWTFLLNNHFAGLEADIPIDTLSQLLQQDPVQDEDDQEVADAVASGHASRGLSASRTIPPSSESFLHIELIHLVARLHSLALQAGTTGSRDAPLCIFRLRRCLLSIANFVPDPTSSTSPAHAIATQRGQALFEAVDAVRADMERHTLGPLKSDLCKALFFVMQLYAVIFSSCARHSNTISGYGVSRLLQALGTESQKTFALAFGPKAQSDEDDEVASIAEESVSAAMSAWLTLCETSSENNESHSAVQASLASLVTIPYIVQRLQGAATLVGEEDDTSEVGEESLPDHEAYNEELVLLASLARAGDLSACLLTLRQQLEGVSHTFSSFYESPGQVSLSPSEMRHLEAEWEKLHWFTLMCGHVLADNSVGEIACVPAEIAALPSAEQEAVNSLLQTTGLRLLHLLLSVGADRPQSPQVLQTLLWFNARWIPAYLLSPSVPLCISSVFGEASGQQILSFLVQHLELIMQSWVADVDIVLQVAAVLRSFSLSEGVMRILLSMPEFEKLIATVLQNLGNLPAKTQNPIISALIGCIYSSAATQDPERFFGRVTESIEERLSSIVHQDNFASPIVFQRADVVASVLNALDLFDGLATSAQPRSRRAVYSFLSRFFDTFVSLARMYRDRVEVVTAIVRTMRDLVRALDLEFGAEDDIVAGLLNGTWQVLEVLDEKALIGDSPSQALEEEVPFEGLCLVLELLLDLRSASESDRTGAPSAWLSPLSAQQTSDVCLFGFSRLVPLLHGVVLDAARVRSALSNLASRLFLAFPHRLLGLAMQGASSVQPSASTGTQLQLLEACNRALSMSLQFDETTATMDCLDAIHALSRAAPRVLAQAQAQAQAGAGGNSASAALHAAQRTMADCLLSHADTVLRAVLVEPLAPSMLGIYVQALRSLVQAAVGVSAGLEDAGAMGQAILQRHLEHFCATTPLTSTLAAARRNTSRGSGSLASSNGSEAQRRRAVLAETVVHLAGLCLTSPSPLSTATTAAAAHSTDNDAGKDDAIFVASARDIAWQGRSRFQLT